MTEEEYMAYCERYKGFDMAPFVDESYCPVPVLETLREARLREDREAIVADQEQQLAPKTERQAFRKIAERVEQLEARDAYFMKKIAQLTSQKNQEGKW